MKVTLFSSLAVALLTIIMVLFSRYPVAETLNHNELGVKKIQTVVTANRIHRDTHISQSSLKQDVPIKKTINETKNSAPSQSVNSINTSSSKAHNPSMNRLEIEVIGIRNHQGKITLTLYDNSKAFENNDYANAMLLISQKIHFQQKSSENDPEKNSGKHHFTIHHLPNGLYALSIFHDENNNDRFDSRLGYPLEGYAYSNQTGHYEAPSFKQAKFKIKSGENHQILELIYH